MSPLGTGLYRIQLFSIFSFLCKNTPSTSTQCFKIQTGSYGRTGITGNRSSFQFFKLIKPKIVFLLRTSRTAVKPCGFLNRKRVFLFLLYRKFRNENGKKSRLGLYGKQLPVCWIYSSKKKT